MAMSFGKNTQKCQPDLPASKKIPEARSKRRRRGANTVERMAAALSPLLSELLGTSVAPDQISIRAARGHWTHGTQDVRQWTGIAKVGCGYHLGSWDNLSSALETGFDLIDNRGKTDAYSDFEVVAKTPVTKWDRTRFKILRRAGS